ncbi:hypothetical protein [uncultured Methanolobus sp.]|uniref:hypothetical protein n=1 Tax=uncultured Methanolobus sp. TaxID=218300 RepID=UPI002AAA7E48|nr:hypothetical protein [uncultured Methanolobus sp.]
MTESITDKDLLVWFQSNYKKIPFINLADLIDERLDRSSRLETTIKKELNIKQELHEQKEILKKMWKDLVANAIIYLKLQDKREKYNDDGDYGIDQLADFFDEYCDFEKLLYGSSDYYRDHVSHVFKVFLLGEYLVREKLPGGFSSIELFDHKLDVSWKKASNDYEDEQERKDKKYTITEQEKEAMWCVVSLTHDLGYPTEIMYKIPEKMRKMLSTFNIDVSYNASHQSQIYNDHILKLVASDLERHSVYSRKGKKYYYTTHIKSKYYSKYSRSLEQWDHGLESCILLAKTLVYFLEMDCSLDERKKMDTLDARHFLIRQRMLKAIASHNCNYIYHLKLDMSFLLRIIDEMQEWGRPRLSDLFSTSPISSLEIKEFTQEIIDYTIQFDYGKCTPVSINIEEAHRNIKEYFRRKIDLYTMVLRSAVDGKNRNFTLKFNVVDKIEISKPVTYQFTHENPKDVTISICYYNSDDSHSTLERDTYVKMSIFENTEAKWKEFYKKYYS